MAQNIRKKLQQAAPQSRDPKAGHRERFAELLERELPQKRQTFPWLKVAAGLAVLAVVGGLLWTSDPTPPQVADTESQENRTPAYTLGDVSPEFRRVENYYLAGIHMELSKLKITDENKELIDGYLQHLQELDEEYQLLNHEINELGLDEGIINALIENLQLRLDLIVELKQKLQQFNLSKNEPFINQQA